MGIYDREYYQKSGRTFLDSVANTGRVWKWLVGINVAVFILQLVTRQPDGLGPITSAFILDTQAVMHGQVWRLLTCAFLHSPVDIFHILFNMLFLWWFGKELEEMYGSREFLTFYLVAAVLSSMAFVGYTWIMQATGAFVDPTRLALGASGAVSAVLLVYAFHFPTRTILLFFLIPVPIWLFVAFFIGKDVYALLVGRHAGVAVEAHLGGALFGFLYYRYSWRLSPLFTRFRLPSFRRRPNLRVYREEEPSREPVAAAVPRSSVDEQLEAKLDAILEKIKVHGQDSLNDEERKLLLRASEIYKNRRSSKGGV